MGVSVNNYNTTNIANYWGVSSFEAGLMVLSNLNVILTVSTVRIKVRDCKIQNQLLLNTSGTNAQFLPSLSIEMERFRGLLCVIQGKRGSLKMDVTLSMTLIGDAIYDGNSDIVPSGGSLIIEGCDQPGKKSLISRRLFLDTNTMTLIKANKLVADSIFIGQNPSALIHQAGLLSVNVDSLQCNTFYAGTYFFVQSDQNRYQTLCWSLYEV